MVFGLIVFLIVIVFVIPYVIYKFGTPTHALGAFQPDLYCSHCKTVAPRNRSANTAQQMLFGGWTCDKCGSENNGFGKKR